MKQKSVKNKNVIVHNDRGDSVRLNKYISESGFCSRREADKLIQSGLVTIDGVKAEMGTKVTKGQKVRVNGILISKEEELVYIALNKPVGITCTTEHKVKGNIVDFVNHKKILRAGNNHEKEYIVTVNKPINDEFVKKMSNGIRILGQVTKKCYVKKEGNNTFRIILTQGLNRQIRRMCESLGYEVVKLKRIRIMNINLSDLKIGKWRELTYNELKGLNELILTSGKTKDVDQ